MEKQLKKELRGHLFRHLDGLVIIPTAYALSQRKVLKYLLDHREVSLDELSEKFSANKGYFNVAIRGLASQGWLDHQIKSSGEVVISTNDKTAIASSLIPYYKHAVELLEISGRYHYRKFEKEPFLALERLYAGYKSKFGMSSTDDSLTQEIQDQVLRHIEGIIVGPTVVALGMSGMFHQYFMKSSFHPSEFHSDGVMFGRLLDIFSDLGWFVKKEETLTFTDKGLFFAQRASAYGVTVSYQPMFRKVDDLLFGDPEVLWQREAGQAELHVDRKMNVWGSGGAHGAYFKKLDDIVIDLFNRPIEDQPSGILDMGCGNGALLIHLYDVIERRTLRGKMLEEHPLYLVGADYNEKALEVTRQNLVQAQVWAKVIWGDISRPDILDADLKEKFGLELSDLLNVRTFLDHNRIWSQPNDDEAISSKSTGAFAYRGSYLSNDIVEQNLSDHFRKWQPYIANFGLVLIELHTIAPSLTAKHLGKTAATAYDLTHGFSDQYILEIDSYKKAAQRAGLRDVAEHSYRFPDNDTATVSINLFKAH